MNKKYIIEIGHTLKLKHNADDKIKFVFGIDSDKPEATKPAIMCAMLDKTNGYNYTFSKKGIASHIITNFDRSALIAKWGN